MNETRARVIESFFNVELGQASLSGRLAEDLERRGAELDIYLALRVLAESEAGKVSYCTLAKRLVLTPSGLTRRIDRLVRQGYATREKSQEDRRSGFAALTPEGRREYERVRPIHEESVMRHFGNKLTEGEARQLGAIMKRVLKGLERQDERD
jgi:DNA-binding MarR family transcriptional regulator